MWRGTRMRFSFKPCDQQLRTTCLQVVTKKRLRCCMKRTHSTRPATRPWETLPRFYGWRDVMRRPNSCIYGTYFLLWVLSFNPVEGIVVANKIRIETLSLTSLERSMCSQLVSTLMIVVQCNILSFGELLRKSVFAFWAGIQYRNNPIVQCMVNSVSQLVSNLRKMVAYHVIRW